LRYTLNELEFCSILERRLDILLFRLGFVPSIFAAKQLISHKKVKVNNHANSSFSRLLKKGDVISFDNSVYPVIYCNLTNH
jgi:ribosomal protein S4